MQKAVPFVEFMYLVFTRMKDVAYSYTVAARMTPALSWATVLAIMMLH